MALVWRVEMVYRMDIRQRITSQWEAQDRFEIETVYRELLATSTGRKFLHYILEITKFMQQPFNGQALGTAFNCGEQNVGKRILADMMEVNPDAFIVLMKEARNAQRTRDEQLAGALADPDSGAYADSIPDA